MNGTNCNENERGLLPYPVILAATKGDPEAMRLRTMHLAYEAVKQSGGTLVIPSAFSEGFVPEGGEKA